MEPLQEAGHTPEVPLTLETLETMEIGTVALNLTRFALVELEKTEAIEEETPSGDTASFMLYNALTFDYKHEYWWSLVTDPHKRLEVVASLIKRKDEKIMARALYHVTHDPELELLRGALPGSLRTDLLEFALNTSNPIQRRQCLQALRTLTPSASIWGDGDLTRDQVAWLASLAREDTATGDQAARLIGHWRLRPAVEAVYKLADADRRVLALLEMQGESGGLPASLPLGLRLAVSLEWIWGRLRARPAAILVTFLLSFLGASLTFGLKEYLSVAGAGFLTMLNLVLALERGALLGAPFALGVLFTRVVAERFTELRTLFRMAASTLLGGIFLSIAIFTYDVLVLMTVPEGTLYIAACFLIALGYALGGLTTARLWKISLATLTTCLALAGSWWAYLNLASSSYALSPVFYFKADWTEIQVLGAILLFALATAILGSLPRLSLRE
jgi:hypothetical protein